MSIRIRLLLLILIAALPILAVQVLHRLGEREAERAQIAATALRLADLQAERMARLVDLAQGVTTSLAQLPSVLARDAPVCTTRIRGMLKRLPVLTGIGVVAPDGTSFCRTGGDDPIYVGDRPYFQKIVRERRFLGSGYILGRAQRAPSMVFASPALDDTGELRAVVLVAFALEALPRLLHTETLPEGATVKLLDSAGNLLARIPAADDRSAEEAAELLRHLRVGERGTAVAAGVDGVRRVFGYVPLPEPADMEVIVGIPLEPALARIDALLWRDLGIIVATFSLAAFAAHFIGETGIRRPLLAVQAAAGRLARGDLGARARLDRRAASEVASLAGSLNEMADAIAARETALAASEEFGRRMLASSRDCIKVLDLDGRLLSINDFGRQALGVAEEADILGRSYPEMWGEAERAEVREAIERARGGEAARFLGKLATGAGRETWWDVSLSPIRDAAGRVERLLVVSRDMTELKQAEEQRELLMAELDHRVKNTLAALQSAARRSLGAGPQATAFAERVAAMANAHTLLSQSGWEGSVLTELLSTTLAAYGGRIRRDGPEVHLDAQTTQSLAVTAHELASNAAKYGALSVPGGHVDLRWELHQNAGRELRLEWVERGGPAVEPPRETGFGLSFVRRSVEHELHGTVSFDFAPEGLRCRLVLPLGAGRRRDSEPAAEEGQEARDAAAERPGPGRRVLVLEDTALVAMEIEAMLEDAGYEVVGPAATVAGAMRLIETRPVDAAVLDVNLNGETSFPVAAALRGRGTPFLFVTGYSSRAIFPPDFARVPRVSKPFQEQHLLGALERLERGGSDVASAPNRAGPSHAGPSAEAAG